MLASVLLFLNIGTSEMVLIMFVVLLLFGGDKMPGIARGLGKGIRDFKDASEGIKREINNQINSFEDKKAEDAAIASHDAQNQLPEGTGPLVEGHPPVENTMPVNENQFVVDEHAPIVSNAEHAEPVLENHGDV